MTVGDLQAKLGWDQSEFNSGMSKSHGDFDRYGSQLESKAKSIGSAVGNALKTGIEAGVVAAGAVMATGMKSAADWEKGMGGVFKTTGLEKGTTEATQMNDSLLQLYSTMKGIKKEDVTGVAGSLGSLGIANDQIAGATKTALMASAAFGISSDTAVTKLGEISNLWQDQTKAAGGTANAFNLMGSTVNALGNKYAATEGNLLNYLSEAGGIAGTFKQAYQPTAAFGALLESVGIKGTEAGTALKSMTLEGLMAGSQQKFNKKTGAYEGGGLGYQYAAQALGISDSAMKAKLSKDLYGTIIEITDAVSRMPLTEFEKTEKLKKIFGSYGFVAAGKISGRGAQYQEMLGTANQAYAEGTSMADEYKSATDNLWDSLSGLKQALDAGAIKVFSDALDPLAEKVDALAQWVRDATPSVVEFVKALASGDWDKVEKMAGDALKGATAKLGEFGKDAWAKIKPGIDYIKTNFGSQIKTALSIGGAIVGLPLVISGLKTIIPVVGEVGGAFGSMALKATGAFGQVAKAAGSSLASAFSPVLGIIGTGGTLLVGVAAVGVGLAALGYSLNPGKFTEFNKVATDALNGIKTTAADVWDSLSKGDFSGAANKLKEAFSSAIDYAKGLNWSALGSEVVTMVGDGAKAIVKTAMDIGGWIHDKLQGWIGGEGPRTLGRGIGNALKGALKAFLGNAAEFNPWDWMKGAWGTITDWTGMGLEIATQFGQGLWDALQVPITNAGTFLYNTIREAGREMVGDAAYINAEIINKIGGAFDSVKTTVEEWWKIVGEKLDAFLQKIGLAQSAKLPDAGGSSSSSGGGDWRPKGYTSGKGGGIVAASYGGAEGYFVPAGLADQILGRVGVSWDPVADWAKSDSGQKAINAYTGGAYSGDTSGSQELINANQTTMNQGAATGTSETEKTIDAVKDLTAAVWSWSPRKPEEAKAEAQAVYDTIFKPMAYLAEKEQQTADKNKDTAEKLAQVPPALASTFQKFDQSTIKFASDMPSVLGSMKGSLGDLSQSVTRSGQHLESAGRQVQVASEAGAHALTLGGNAVTIGLNEATGQMVAHIGSVGQQLESSGTKVKAYVEGSGTTFSAYIDGAADSHALKIGGSADKHVLRIGGSADYHATKIGDSADDFNTDVGDAGKNISDAGTSFDTTVAGPSGTAYTFDSVVGGTGKTLSEALNGVALKFEKIDLSKAFGYANPLGGTGASATSGTSTAPKGGSGASSTTDSTASIGAGVGGITGDVFSKTFNNNTIALEANTEADDNLCAALNNTGIEGGLLPFPAELKYTPGAITDERASAARQAPAEGVIDRTKEYWDGMCSDLLEMDKTMQYTASQEIDVRASAERISTANFCGSTEASGEKSGESIEQGASSAGKTAVRTQERVSASQVNTQQQIGNLNLANAAQGGGIWKSSVVEGTQIAATGAQSINQGRLATEGTINAGHKATAAAIDSGNLTTATAINTNTKAAVDANNSAIKTNWDAVSGGWATVGGTVSKDWKDVNSADTGVPFTWRTGVGDSKDAWKTGVDDGVKVFIKGSWVAANSVAGATGMKYNSETGTYQRDPNVAWGTGPSVGPYFNWGQGTGPGSVGVATPGESQPSWMPSWTNQAEGGVVSRPTLTMFGEAGREAFVPLDDKAAGWKILERILPEFGIPMTARGTKVRKFAEGGIVMPKVAERKPLSIDSNVAQAIANIIVNVQGNSNSPKEIILEVDGTKMARALIDKFEDAKDNRFRLKTGIKGR